MSVVEETLALATQRPGELLAVVGPTATGKTELAVAIAEKLGGEVISADSVQIYRSFDVGSGKPTAAEQARARHHLVSVLDPAQHVDAAAWAGLAAAAVADVRARGRVPILCGGTFLWTRALLFGLAEIPGASAELRERYRMTAEADGRSALHDRLRAVDRPSAERLHPNDFVRVSRALEVFELTGRPLSDWHREHAFARAQHRARLVAIAVEPGTLTDRIRTRVRRWLEEGWIEEVEGLLRAGYADTRPMGSVGYTQVRAVIEGRAARTDLELAVVRATRVFARRQRTWLNHVDVTWVGQSSSGT